MTSRPQQDFLFVEFFGFYPLLRASSALIFSVFQANFYTADRHVSPSLKLHIFCFWMHLLQIFVLIGHYSTFARKIESANFPLGSSNRTNRIAPAEKSGEVRLRVLFPNRFWSIGEGRQIFSKSCSILGKIDILLLALVYC